MTKCKLTIYIFEFTHPMGRVRGDMGLPCSYYLVLVSSGILQGLGLAEIHIWEYAQTDNGSGGYEGPQV